MIDYYNALVKPKPTITNKWHRDPLFSLNSHVPKALAVPQTGKALGEYWEDLSGFVPLSSRPWFIQIIPPVICFWKGDLESLDLLFP